MCTTRLDGRHCAFDAVDQNSVDPLFTCKQTHLHSLTKQRDRGEHP